MDLPNVIPINKQPEELRENKQELDFLQAVARRLPEDTGVLRALADLYTRTGAYADGLRGTLGVEPIEHHTADAPR